MQLLRPVLCGRWPGHLVGDGEGGGGDGEGGGRWGGGEGGRDLHEENTHTRISREVERCIKDTQCAGVYRLLF